jgi:hypothetical protein
VDRHTDVNLARADQIDNHAEPVQRPKDPRQEPMRDRLPVRVDVDDDDRVLDGDRRRKVLREFLDRPRLGDLRSRPSLSVDRGRRLRVDDGPAARRVLDPDGDARSDDLLHRERMDDLAAIVGELGGLVGGDDRDETSGRDLARVGGEDAVDFFPDLELGGFKTDGDEGGTEVGVASTDLLEKRAGDDAEVACNPAKRRKRET